MELKTYYGMFSNRSKSNELQILKKETQKISRGYTLFSVGNNTEFPVSAVSKRSVGVEPRHLKNFLLQEAQKNIDGHSKSWLNRTNRNQSIKSASRTELTAPAKFRTHGGVNFPAYIRALMKPRLSKLQREDRKTIPE